MRIKVLTLIAVIAGLTLSVRTNAQTAQTSSKTVEDGGSGPYKALMIQEISLPTHTIFRPKDISAFGPKASCQ